jgi:hypothetical protein
MYEGYRAPERLDSPDFLRLRVTIRGSSPKIRRDILIPENATFEDLHLAIQVGFGWRDAHLHRFDAGFAVGPDALNDGSASEPKALDERLTWLCDLPWGMALSYEYDFGNDWDHVVERIARVPAEGRERRPYIAGGCGAGPAEDCGGIEAWNGLAGRLRKGSVTEEEAEWLDGTGYGRGYDADAFDAGAADERLGRIEFDIAATWTGHLRKRSSIQVSAPFLVDRSDAVRESGLAADAGPRP